MKQLSEIKTQYSRTGLGPNISIGEFTYGNPEFIQYGKLPVSIGKFSSIANDVKILCGGEHHTETCTTFPFDVLLQRNDLAPLNQVDFPIQIGNDVWIGHGAMILSGVTIGDGAVIGARTVVSKDIPPYAVAVGSPVQIKRYRYPEHTIKELLEQKWWDRSEEEIERLIPYLMGEDVEQLLKELKR
jgi:acetyltransferase-like isoleucine patch superfamily enzyme